MEYIDIYLKKRVYLWGNIDRKRKTQYAAITLSTSCGESRKQQVHGVSLAEMKGFDL